MARRLWTLVAGLGLALGGLIAPAAVGAAGPNTLTAQLSGAHEVPPVATAGTGSATVTIQGDGASIQYQVTYSGLSGPVVAGHIHLGAVGANGPIILPFTAGPSPMSGTLTAANFSAPPAWPRPPAPPTVPPGGRSRGTPPGQPVPPGRIRLAPARVRPRWRGPGQQRSPPL